GFAHHKSTLNCKRQIMSFAPSFVIWGLVSFIFATIFVFDVFCSHLLSYLVIIGVGDSNQSIFNNRSVIKFRRIRRWRGTDIDYSSYDLVEGNWELSCHCEEML